MRAKKSPTLGPSESRKVGRSFLVRFLFFSRNDSGSQSYALGEFVIGYVMESTDRHWQPIRHRLYGQVAGDPERYNQEEVGDALRETFAGL